MGYSAAQLAALWTANGGPASQASYAASVSAAENGSGNPSSTNVNKDGTTDFGLWQINSSNFAGLSQALGTPVNSSTITDPNLNARAAVALATTNTGGTRGWLNWSTVANNVNGLGASNPTYAQSAVGTNPSDPFTTTTLLSNFFSNALGAPATSSLPSGSQQVTTATQAVSDAGGIGSAVTGAVSTVQGWGWTVGFFVLGVVIILGGFMLAAANNSSVQTAVKTAAKGALA